MIYIIKKFPAEIPDALFYLNKHTHNIQMYLQTHGIRTRSQPMTQIERRLVDLDDLTKDIVRVGLSRIPDSRAITYWQVYSYSGTQKHLNELLAEPNFSDFLELIADNIHNFSHDSDVQGFIDAIRSHGHMKYVLSGDYSSVRPDLRDTLEAFLGELRKHYRA